MPTLPSARSRTKQQSLTLQAQTDLSNGDQFRSIIVATRNGRPVQVLTLYITPVLYIYMERIAQGARALPARIGRGFPERKAEV